MNPALARAHDRAWRWLAGPDGARGGLPCNELLAPVPLLALALVAANDWWWKPRGVLPAWALGKLSDLGGVIALPLVITAALDLALWVAVRLGAPVDPTLRRWKLGGALALTAAALITTKLSPAVAREVAALVGHLGRDAHIVADPRDLIVLPALVVPWWHGRRTLARVAYGRVAWLRARRVAPAIGLADAVAAGADATAIAAVAAAGSDAEVDAALARLRSA